MKKWREGDTVQWCTGKAQEKHCTRSWISILILAFCIFWLPFPHLCCGNNILSVILIGLHLACEILEGTTTSYPAVYTQYLTQDLAENRGWQTSAELSQMGMSTKVNSKLEKHYTSEEKEGLPLSVGQNYVPHHLSNIQRHWNSIWK